jgi:hypothetical protein
MCKSIKKANLQICGTYLRTAHLWISLGRLQYGCSNICIFRWVIVQEIMISMQYACNLFSSLCNLFSLFLSANTSFIPQHFEIFQLMKFLSCLAFSEVLIHFIHTIQFPFNAIFLGSFSAKWRNVNALKACAALQWLQLIFYESILSFLALAFLFKKS